MTPEETFTSRLRVSPRDCPKRLAREVGISGRAARRLVLQLEAEGVLRSRLRGRLLIGGGLVAGLCAIGTWLTPSSTPAKPTVPKPVSPEVLQTERDLYSALDTQDAGRIEEARQQLRSEEEVLRLAALRYLASVSATDHVQELLPLFEDPSDRVRSVAIQMVGAVPGPEVEAGLVSVAAGPERPLAERLLALSRLKQRAASAPERVATGVLPVLLDRSQVLREETSTLLALLTGKRVTVGATTPEALHGAWREALGVVE